MSYERVVGLYVTDEAEYQRYREAMTPILQSHGGSFGYDFRVSEVLLSKADENINRVFTIEFPSKQTMEAFFTNPEYVAVRDRHFNASVGSVTSIAMYEKTT